MIVRVTDDWLPLPDALIRQLDLKDGDTFEVDVIEGVLVLTPCEPEPKSGPSKPLPGKPLRK